MSRNSVRLAIDEDTVTNKLLMLKVDKAQGPDDIYPSVLRNCAQAAAIPLTIIYSKSLEKRHPSQRLENGSNSTDIQKRQ